MNNPMPTARIVALTLALTLAACASPPTDERQSVSIAGFGPGFAPGYLAEADIPSSLVQVPPPPAAGSAALALDHDIAERSFAFYETPRWTQAIIDADLTFPNAASAFSCALGTAINETDTPRLYRLLRRTLTDLGRSTRAAKVHYDRRRPFVENQHPLCTPQTKGRLEHDGSYPSGHNAIGWGWALILAELSPAQTDALLVRGRNFGESRNVCNVHWHSDVMQGRLVGAGMVARLHAEPAFRADLLAAQAEIDQARRQGLKPSRDCQAEAAALASGPSLAQ
jgi:acid phosphatase (class A)